MKLLVIIEFIKILSVKFSVFFRDICINKFKCVNFKFLYFINVNVIFYLSFFDINW